MSKKIKMRFHHFLRFIKYNLINKQKLQDKSNKLIFIRFSHKTSNANNFQLEVMEFLF